MTHLPHLHPRLAVRIFAEENKAFGPGVMRLLHNVRRLSSLRAAAQEMGMAYSKAWRIMKECEDALGFPLLRSTTGGRHGGGAALTEEAKLLLSRYEAYTAALNDASESLFRSHFADLEEALSALQKENEEDPL